MGNGEFLKEVFRYCDDGRVNFRFLPSAVNVFHPLDNLPTLPVFPSNQDIYFAMASRNGGGAREHIVQIPCVWVDCDFKSTGKEEIEKKLKEFICRPSFIINSGGGYHAYWLLKEPLKKESIAEVENVLRRLARYFNGDMACTDASRILRVPGTINNKPEYNPSPTVKIIYARPEKRYELSDLDMYFPADEKTQVSPKEFRNEKGWQDDVLKGVADGNRHRGALKLAGRLAEKGHSDAEIIQFLIAWNQNNNPPKDTLADPNSKEMQDIIAYVRGKHGEEEDPLVFPSHLLTGAAGAFAKTYAEHLEVPAHFLWISYLTCLGSITSGLVTLDSEIRPSTRIFALLLGESADDRKSTAIAKTVNFFKEHVHQFTSCWGIGSAEGLQKLMVKNSNLLLVFDEFKQFVSKCKIDGSILLPCVNSLYENTWYESHTVKSDVNISNAHLSLLAASTTQTYERIWDSAFLDIGLPNRLFLVPGKGTRRFSIPSKVGDLPGLKNDLISVLHHVGSQGEYTISQEARDLYHDWYMSLQPSAHTKRLDTYALRFMVLLTVNELKREVDADIVRKVIDLMDWQLEVRQTLDPIDADSKTARMEESIRRALKRKNLTDRELKQTVHANREGLWIYNSALRNLRNEREVIWGKEGKAWQLGKV